MIEFPKYAKIKDRYCVCYFGHSDEYVLQIALLKPLIEKKYKGINIFIGCRDETSKLFENSEFILKHSELRSRKLDFGYIREIKFNGKTHPVEDFIQEAKLENYTICQNSQQEKTTRCVILTQGSYPTKPLTQTQIDKLIIMARHAGFEPELNTSVKNSGLVIGVESFGLFEAASQGIQTKLIVTGIGEKLFQNMFPQGEIIKL